MAQAGRTVFSSKCSGCHGVNGEGRTAPALWGSGANLGKYNTGKGLLDFISATMPLSSPGSLSQQDYLGVLSLLLVQNNFTGGSTAFNEADLSGIALK